MTFVYFSFSFSLFNIISIHWLSNAKAILADEQWWYYFTIWCGNNGVHAFPEGMSQKVNVIAQLEFEIVYYDVAVQLH